MSREVIANNGTHYRIHPVWSHIIQQQDKAGARWRTHVACKQTPDATAEEVAAAWLAMLGRLPVSEEAPPDNRVMTVAGVLEPCTCGEMPWYMFGDVSYVGCSHCGRQTDKYATRQEAVDAWNQASQENGMRQQ